MRLTIVRSSRGRVDSDPEQLQSYKGRIILIGPTQAGRMLAVVLDTQGRGVYYPVTARPASRKERRYYQQQKGGEAHDDA